MLRRFGSPPDAENHKAEGKANSKVGSPTNTAILFGEKTLSEPQSHESMNAGRHPDIPGADRKL
jgi:hypothetical protein